MELTDKFEGQEETFQNDTFRWQQLFLGIHSERAHFWLLFYLKKNRIANYITTTNNANIKQQLLLLPPLQLPIITPHVYNAYITRQYNEVL